MCAIYKDLSFVGRDFEIFSSIFFSAHLIKYLVLNVFNESTELFIDKLAIMIYGLLLTEIDKRSGIIEL